MDVFLTGSRAYGTPREDSDVDLAVLVEVPLLMKLRALAEKPIPAPGATITGALPEKKSLGQGRGADDPGDSLRFGRLNLLCFTSEVVFEAWRESTENLILRRPVAREEACRTIKSKVRTALSLEIATRRQREDLDAKIEDGSPF